MNAILKDSAPCLKQLRVDVPTETVQAEFNTVYRELKRVAHVPGFRVGFSPRDLLERYHGEKAREEVIRRLVGRSLDEALSAQGQMDLVGRPQVTDVQWEPGQPLTYTAQLEIAPEVPLGRYKGLKLTRPKVEVTENHVSEALERLRQTNAELKPLLEARPAAAGDFLLVDLDGGQKDRMIHLDLEQDPEGILKPLLGMRPAESRTVTLKDGKVIPVFLKSIKVKDVLPLNDDFAKTIGSYETLEALTEAIRKDLAVQAESSRRGALEGQVLHQLVEEWEFDVPPSLVASQARRLLKERAMELMNQGVPAPQVQTQAQMLTDQAKVDALKQVRMFFILRRIAAVEQFSATEEEMRARIQTLSARLGSSEEEVRKDLEAKDLLDEMEWGIVRGKVLERIIQEAEIKEG
jgi:trigger factor